AVVSRGSDVATGVDARHLRLPGVHALAVAEDDAVAAVPVHVDVPGRARVEMEVAVRVRDVETAEVSADELHEVAVAAERERQARDRLRDVLAHVRRGRSSAERRRVARAGRTLDALLTLRTLWTDRKSTRLNSSHRTISYAVFCLKK